MAGMKVKKVSTGATKKATARELRQIEAVNPVKIGGQYLQVKLVNKQHCENSWGCVHFTTGEMFVWKKELGFDRIVRTLWHELLHAVIDDRVNWSNFEAFSKAEDKSELTDWVEEDLVCGLEGGLLSLLADNPKLVALLAKTGRRRRG